MRMRNRYVKLAKRLHMRMRISHTPARATAGQRSYMELLRGRRESRERGYVRTYVYTYNMYDASASAHEGQVLKFEDGRFSRVGVRRQGSARLNCRGHIQGQGLGEALSNCCHSGMLP